VYGASSLLNNYTTEDKSVEELIEAQRKLSVSPDAFERVVGSLLVAARLKRRLTALSDHAVGQLVFDHVWNVLGVFSPELTICEVATERLRKRVMASGQLGGQ
jgi:hypothetical protein